MQKMIPVPPKTWKDHSRIDSAHKREELSVNFRGVFMNKVSTSMDGRPRHDYSRNQHYCLVEFITFITNRLLIGVLV